jgi:hypothetical protein
MWNRGQCRLLCSNLWRWCPCWVRLHTKCWGRGRKDLAGIEGRQVLRYLPEQTDSKQHSWFEAKHRRHLLRWRDEFPWRFGIPFQLRNREHQVDPDLNRSLHKLCSGRRWNLPPLFSLQSFSSSKSCRFKMSRRNAYSLASTHTFRRTVRSTLERWRSLLLWSRKQGPSCCRSSWRPWCHRRCFRRWHRRRRSWRRHHFSSNKFLRCTTSKWNAYSQELSLIFLHIGRRILEHLSNLFPWSRKPKPNCFHSTKLPLPESCMIGSVPNS